MAYRFNRYDTDKFTDGEWVEIEGGQFKVAKYGNAEHLEVAEEINKRNKRKYQSGDVPVQVMIEDSAEELARGVLKDWKDIEGEDEAGKPCPVPFSVENAKILLMNDEPLRNRIKRESQDLSRFERERIGEQAKKRKTTSGS